MTALAALNAAYDAWRLSQPQLFWTDANLFGLEEDDVARAEGLPATGCGVVFLEPASRRPPLAADGGLAQSFNGRDALPDVSARPGQGGEH